MALTEEKLKIKIEIDYKFSYKGKPLDFQDLEILKIGLIDDIGNSIYERLDSISFEQEDSNEEDYKINIEFINDY